MRTTVLPAVLLAAAALAACSRPTVGAYPEDYEAAVCSWATECSVFRSEQQCRESLILDTYPRLLYLLDAAAAGRVEFSASKAEACLDALAVMPCAGDVLDGVLYQNDLRREPEVCRDVFVGKVRNYDPCMNSEECAGADPVCGFDPSCTDACCAGGCRDRGAGPAEGEPCSGNCASGLFCAQDPATFAFTVCEPKRAAGGACTSFDNCVDGTFCDGATCRAEAAAGQACGWDDQCADGLLCTGGQCTAPGGEGDACDPDEWRSCRRFDNECDPETRRCAPLRGPGDACDYDCVPYADCSYTGVDTRTCISRASLGEFCGPRDNGDYSYYIECLGHLRCNDGVCDEPELEAACPVP